MKIKGREFLVIGHRGSLPGLENTLAAFAFAKKFGADAIETDVREAYGKQLVLSHDATLQRVAHVNIRVRTHTLTELKKYYPIPTVAELIKSYDGLINLEIKEPSVVNTLVPLVAKMGAMKRVVFSSFFPHVLSRIRKIAPHARIWFLLVGAHIISPAILFLARLFDKNIHSEALCPFYFMVTPWFVNMAHRFGYKVYTWTVNSEEDIIKMYKMGVDGIFTDNVKVAMKTLQKLMKK